CLEPDLYVRTLLKVNAFHEADLAGAQGHDHGRCSRAFAEEAHPFEEGAVGDSSCGEDELFAGREIFGFVDAVLVFDAHALRALFLVWFHNQAPEHVAIQAADGSRSNYAFGCATGSHDRVYASPDDGGGDAGREIAVADEPDAGPGRADVGNQLFVARAVEHD